MVTNQFFEKKGPFPLSKIIKVIGCSRVFSQENNFEISSFESLDNASTNDMTFLNSSKYQELSLKTKAAACITSPNLSKFLPKKCIKLDVKNVLFAVTKASKMFYPNADIDFEQIDQLLALAKENISKGNIEQTKQVIGKISSEGKLIQELLYEISEQNRIHKAKQFVQKHAERINSLILQAKTFGLDKTANVLAQSQIQLLQANTTGQIKQQFKIIIIHQQKVEQVKETNQAELLRLQALLVPLEKKAQRLADDLKENNTADYLLKRAFNLIEEVKQDIKELEYAPGRINDTKYLDLTIGKKIQTIKDLLIKAEKIIYISS